MGNDFGGKSPVPERHLLDCSCASEPKKRRPGRLMLLSHEGNTGLATTGTATQAVVILRRLYGLSAMTRSLPNG